MKFKNLVWAFLFLTISACMTASKKPEDPPVKSVTQRVNSGTLVIRPVEFERVEDISQTVKRECNLLGKLSQFVKRSANSQYAKIISNSHSTPSRAEVLQIDIEQVKGGRGGIWSGGKMILIKGKLTKDGMVLGTFRGRRYYVDEGFAGYKGGCAVLTRCLNALGIDIAGWLGNPTHEAVLGGL